MSTLTFFPVTGDFHAVDDPEPWSTSSAPNVEAIQGLVRFYPRLPKGFTAYRDDYDISPNANCVQSVTMIGAITGGVWGLNFDGLWTDPYMAAGATAAAVQAALEAIPTVGAGNVTVTKAAGIGTPYVVTLVGALAASPQTQMLADAGQLTVSSGSPHVSVVMLNGGSAQRVAPAAIGIPPREGRIWTTGQLCSINQLDTPNVELLANVDLNLEWDPADLIYDVSFTNVWFNDAPRNLAPFAFLAPTDTTEVCLTDPSLERLPYFTPLQDTWYPGWSPYVPPSAGSGPGNVRSLPSRGWRERAAG
jgi:hypothetical protein